MVSALRSVDCVPPREIGYEPIVSVPDLEAHEDFFLADPSLAFRMTIKRKHSHCRTSITRHCPFVIPSQASAPPRGIEYGTMITVSRSGSRIDMPLGGPPPADPSLVGDDNIGVLLLDICGEHHPCDKNGRKISARFSLIITFPYLEIRRSYENNTYCFKNRSVFCKKSMFDSLLRNPCPSPGYFT